MHHPPEPHYSFTIPSIHDDTTLDCRIYHPQEVWRPQSHDNGNSRPWQKRGIIMAHPYAPLGGSYDDRVVGIVVEEYLALGYVVGTFNFRYPPFACLYRGRGTDDALKRRAWFQRTYKLVWQTRSQ